ncbi:MAG: hypothetical protein ETSY1_45735 [Candidatus Entotheonella factor]|uniref:Uncharacterized protein n=1 Tax=Entotheonella factor TaxID=1429438 RepID=W4L3U2_ENTF1|nr:MAG: hypothetical protein ETSY1_45735 [Candidatus Entotheonella factor]
MISTTHSPLVMLGMEPDEVVVLKSENHSIRAVWQLPDCSDVSAEDIIADERLFDTLPTRPEVAAELERYRELLAIPKSQRSPAEVAELTTHARSVQNRKSSGEPTSPLLDDIRALREKYSCECV